MHTDLEQVFNEIPWRNKHRRKPDCSISEQFRPDQIDAARTYFKSAGETGYASDRAAWLFSDDAGDVIAVTEEAKNFD